jgi:hypothetical protein
MTKAKVSNGNCWECSRMFPVTQLVKCTVCNKWQVCGESGHSHRGNPHCTLEAHAETCKANMSLARHAANALVGLMPKQSKAKRDAMVAAFTWVLVYRMHKIGPGRCDKV